MRRIRPLGLDHVFAILVVALLLTGCGAVGVVKTAANVTYKATKTTVKAAGTAAKWTYNGARKVTAKVTGSDDEAYEDSTSDYEDSDSDYVDADDTSDHTASTSSIRLPEVVKRP
jgi:ABC-type uncharacterized transport system auxiliary subunit